MYPKARQVQGAIATLNLCKFYAILGNYSHVSLTCSDTSRQASSMLARSHRLEYLLKTMNALANACTLVKESADQAPPFQPPQRFCSFLTRLISISSQKFLPRQVTLWNLCLERGFSSSRKQCPTEAQTMFHLINYKNSTKELQTTNAFGRLYLQSLEPSLRFVSVIDCPQSCAWHSASRESGFT